jgi:hypothetical protein
MHVPDLCRGRLMLPYWLFFLLPCVGLFINRQLNQRSQVWSWSAIGLFFALAMGMRYQVGGDWGAYLRMLEMQSGRSLGDVITGEDPGFYLLCWLVERAGGSIYWVNTLCGMIVMAGVVRFCRSLPLPWLALLVSVPYLIIVVGMGYTRQAAALGFLMLGLVSLTNQSLRWFLFWTLLGATFHKSAVLMLPVAALASTSNRFWSLFWGGVISIAAGYLFLLDSAAYLWTNYVEADYQSQGGMIRVLMNAVPATLFLSLNRRMRLSAGEQKLWFWMSVFSLACIPLVVLSSTATDRVALYLIPIQLFVFAHLPFLAKESSLRATIALAVVCYYAFVQFVWLVFGAHSYAWVPYQVFWLI